MPSSPDPSRHDPEVSRRLMHIFVNRHDSDAWTLAPGGTPENWYTEKLRELGWPPPLDERRLATIRAEIERESGEQQ